MRRALVRTRRVHMAAVPGLVEPRLGQGRRLQRRERELTFDSAAYAWLKAHAGWFGWNHPGVMEPGGSIPEPWHWEWVGDGGRMYPGLNFGFGSGFGIAVGGNPVGTLDGASHASVNGWSGTATCPDGRSIPTRRVRPMCTCTSTASESRYRANKPRADISELFAGYDASPAPASPERSTPPTASARFAPSASTSPARASTRC